MTGETAPNTTHAFSEKLPLRMTSKVVRGFGRGSKDLGIPTANLDRSPETFCCTTTFDDLPTGIYWGFGRIGSHPETYKTACSIGYNPTYGNDFKTVEPHLIAPPQDPHRHASSCGESILEDFYDQPIRLSVVGYLRPELPFEGIEKLVQAIKQDIVNSEQHGNAHDEITLQEREWVASEEPIVAKPSS